MMTKMHDPDLIVNFDNPLSKYVGVQPITAPTGNIISPIKLKSCTLDDLISECESRGYTINNKPRTPINIVQQRKNGCVLACISMLTNIPLDDVYDIYPEFNNIGVSTEDTLLILKRLGYDPVQYVQPKCFPKRSYIVTAPSLNHPGHNHAVVIDNCCVYDPNNGTGEKYYTTETLFSWSEVIEIVTE